MYGCESDLDVIQAWLDFQNPPDDGHTFTVEVEVEDSGDDPLFLDVPADAVRDMLDVGYETWLRHQAVTS